jgi:cobalt-precorrin-5B (C1)-methyltransferase
MDKPLKKGWTTGACAAGAAKAAWAALTQGAFPDPVAVELPRGVVASFALSRAETGAGWARAGIIKDAGDDPDVTHGAEIVVTVVARPAGSGLAFQAGPGVGTVTLPGLPLAVGEPAINPGPRAQILANMEAVKAPIDARLTIAIPGGEELAAKTMNARLGIVGGLSILGTTGVVMPYSCAAWIHSIHRGIDVARALGIAHVAASTGRTSEQAVQKMYGLPEQALIDMGDFAGPVLKYLRRHPIQRLTIAGGFGKLAKLAAGELDLHSRESTVDVGFLARLMAGLGAPAELVARAAACESAAQVLALARALPMGDAVARAARETAMAALAGSIEVDVAVFDRSGTLVGHARQQS